MPSGARKTNDTPANLLQAVTITTTPAAGPLNLNNVAVVAGDSVLAAYIASGLPKFAYALTLHDALPISFTFQVQDNGGTASGGVDLDQSANTLTINVTSVNDAPAGTDNTRTHV